MCVKAAIKLPVGLNWPEPSWGEKEKENRGHRASLLNIFPSFFSFLLVALILLSSLFCLSLFLFLFFTLLFLVLFLLLFSAELPPHRYLVTLIPFILWCIPISFQSVPPPALLLPTSSQVCMTPQQFVHFSLYFLGILQDGTIHV